MSNLKIILILIILIVFKANSQSQNMWYDYGYNHFTDYLVEDLSIDSLKSIVLQDKPLDSYILYNAAIQKLFYYHKDTQFEFLSNNLNTEIDTSLPVIFEYHNFQKIYTDAYILGLLGNAEGVSKMINLADFAIKDIKIKAIRRLGEIGIYDYYNFIENEYLNDPNDQQIISLLALYACDERYQEEIRTILLNRVYSATTYFEVIGRAGDLGCIPGASIAILDEFFRIKTGKERYDYFFELGVYDKDGQPERSMFALQNEVNDTFRVEYLPSPDIVISWNSISKRYLEPKFVNFLKGLNVTDPNSMTYKMKEFFLLAFVPVPPDSAKPTLDLLDNLNNYVDSVSNYTWLGDLQFKDELQSILQTAQSNLQSGDSLDCAAMVKAFQDEVDFVYKDSLNVDPRFVTLEGWKFLYWNAQYILDRLPTPPVIVQLELNDISPAMSMKNQPGAFTMEVYGSGFTSSSTVYFNGQARATTYVSDSTLTAAILSSDVSAAGNFLVWVSDGTTNSDTLVFKVVNNLPKEILPIMNCVTNNGNGTYTAYFGYNNKNSVSVFVPIYSQNKISPDPWDRGQPGVFKVGIQERVFSVTWTSGNIIWHLNNNIATAKKTSPPCP